MSFAADRPRLRPVESFPVHQGDGEVLFALRDPDGFASSVLLPYPAAVLASLMDGSRTHEELREEYFHRFGRPLERDDLAALLSQLDDRWLLDSDRFRIYWKAEVTGFLNSSVRPAAHAGRAYPGDPGQLRLQLDADLAAEPDDAPSSADSPPGQLCGLLSPHVDLRRAGPCLAQAYRRVARHSPAELFVLLGTAHHRMSEPFSLTRKDFETPLGRIETDQRFVNRLRGALAAEPGGRQCDLLANELAHRPEHALEFQVLWLQHVLGDRRPLRIVPILVGSFGGLITAGSSPSESPPVAAFITALRAVLAEETAPYCLVGSVDLAHVGQRYGDHALLAPADLQAQTAADRRLLDWVVRADARGMFDQVAREQDRRRICGLAPAYTLLEVLRPRQGELLKYGQAVEPDGTSCVTFASVAFSR
jgi:hypothetical protein